MLCLLLLAQFTGADKAAPLYSTAVGTQWVWSVRYPDDLLHTEYVLESVLEERVVDGRRYVRIGSWTTSGNPWDAVTVATESWGEYWSTYDAASGRHLFGDYIDRGGEGSVEPAKRVDPVPPPEKTDFLLETLSPSPEGRRLVLGRDTAVVTQSGVTVSTRAGDFACDVVDITTAATDDDDAYRTVRYQAAGPGLVKYESYDADGRLDQVQTLIGYRNGRSLPTADSLPDDLFGPAPVGTKWTYRIREQDWDSSEPNVMTSRETWTVLGHDVFTDPTVKDGTATLMRIEFDSTPLLTFQSLLGITNRPEPSVEVAWEGVYGGAYVSVEGPEAAGETLPPQAKQLKEAYPLSAAPPVLGSTVSEEYVGVIRTVAVGRESVTVPAGTFEAIRIDRDPVQPGADSAGYRDWWVPGVGWVKGEIHSNRLGGPLNYRAELTSFVSVDANDTKLDPAR